MITTHLPNTSIEPKAGSYFLLVGPRSLNATMLNLIARLLAPEPAAMAQARAGEGGSSGPHPTGTLPALRVLDGGNRFNAYTVARLVGGRQEVMSRITVSRAFTCYQVLSLLQSTPTSTCPFVILDLLNTFYDESVRAGERKHLLQGCLAALQRLVKAAGGVVSVHPPAVPSQTAVELLKMLQAATEDTYVIQPVPPAPEPLRLF